MSRGLGRLLPGGLATATTLGGGGGIRLRCFSGSMTVADTFPTTSEVTAAITALYATHTTTPQTGDVLLFAPSGGFLHFLVIETAVSQNPPATFEVAAGFLAIDISPNLLWTAL